MTSDIKVDAEYMTITRVVAKKQAEYSKTHANPATHIVLPLVLQPVLNAVMERYGVPHKLPVTETDIFLSMKIVWTSGQQIQVGELL